MRRNIFTTCLNHAGFDCVIINTAGCHFKNTKINLPQRTSTSLEETPDHLERVYQRFLEQKYYTVMYQKYIIIH